MDIRHVLKPRCRFKDVPRPHLSYGISDSGNESNELYSSKRHAEPKLFAPSSRRHITLIHWVMMLTLSASLFNCCSDFISSSLRHPIVSWQHVFFHGNRYDLSFVQSYWLCHLPSIQLWVSIDSQPISINLTLSPPPSNRNTRLTWHQIFHIIWKSWYGSVDQSSNFADVESC